MEIKRYVLPSVAAIVLIGGFFLPSAVAGIMDSRRLDNLAVIGAQSISFEIDTQISLSGRVALAASASVEVLAIETGQAMNIETAGETAVNEIVKFFGGGGIELDADECTVESGSAMFVINSDDPSINMIIWEFRVNDRHSNSVTVTIDDETGVILKMILQQENGVPMGGSNIQIIPDMSDVDMRDIAHGLTEMMAEYYGTPVSLVDFTAGINISYYRADLHTDDMVVPMYGVVRANGFTMNERI